MKLIGLNINRRYVMYGSCLLAFLILLLVILSNLPNRVEIVPINPAVTPIKFREFLLSEDYFQLIPKQYFSRDRKVSWSLDQVKRFWVPIEDVIESYLSEENEKRIIDIFSDVP